jgi:hypothetical protein
MLKSRQRVVSIFALALVGVLISFAAGTSAQAVSYRYWTYWTTHNGSWEFRQIGPAANIPKDGSVEGWKFAISSQTGDEQAKPAFTAVDTFQEICGSTPAVTQKKRIALVIDPGTPQSAPQDEQPGSLTSACVQIEPSATGYNVLRSVFQVRTSLGLICGIDGYPAFECADVLDESTSAMESTSTSSGESISSSSPLPVVIVAVILGVGGGLLWHLRRRK